MTQQIAKLTTANEVKNTEIKKLHEELHDVRVKFQQELKELDFKMKNDRK